MNDKDVKTIKSLEEDEVKQRVFSALELIESYRTEPQLVATQLLLNKVKSVLLPEESTDLQPVTPKQSSTKPKHVIISCDASVKKNPGGPCSIGYVIQNKDNEPISNSMLCPAKTNNQAEYDAIYAGLTNFIDLVNNPGCEVEIRSDSKLAVDQLNGNKKCNDKELARRKDIILELVSHLPFPVSFQWRPRNSTPELELANYLAQDAISVPRH